MKSEQLVSNADLADILLVIRQTNALCSSDAISWEQRRAMQNAIAPDLGSLDTETKGKGKHLKKKEGTKIYRVSLP